MNIKNIPTNSGQTLPYPVAVDFKNELGVNSFHLLLRHISGAKECE